MKTFSRPYSGVTGPVAILDASDHIDASRNLSQTWDALLAGGPLDATDTIPCGSTHRDRARDYGFTIRP